MTFAKSNVVVEVAILGLLLAGGARTSGQNIALGHSYTWDVAPSFSGCTDSGDITQLTDGAFATAYPIWSDLATVGWGPYINGTQRREITIDLGTDQPICGAMFSTCASVPAGIQFPANILVLASSNNVDYYAITDLVYSDTGPGALRQGYSKYQYTTYSLHAHGRYVKFLVFPWVEVSSDGWLFCDEIQVYRGEDSWVNDPIPGPIFSLSDTDAGLVRRMYFDLSQAKIAVNNASISGALKTQLLSDLATAESGFSALTPVADPSSYRAVFPLNTSHAAILGVFGALMNAAGKPALAAWVTDYQDLMDDPTQLPPASPVTTILIAAMPNESRPVTINLTNSTQTANTARVTITGLPGSTGLSVSSVDWVDSKRNFRTLKPYAPVAVPLNPISQPGSGYPITLPAGMTRQIWLELKPDASLTPGTYNGYAVITPSSGSAIQMPVTMRVFSNMVFPTDPTLRLGGCDFTHRSDYRGFTSQTRSSFISLLHSKYVDTTWGAYDVLPYGTYDANGNMVTQPSTTNFDAWVALWPAGMRFVVQISPDNLGGLQRGTPAFNAAVTNWVTFWANHLTSSGISPSRLFLSIWDEPDTQAEDQIIIDWATPIQNAATGIQIWNDPCWADPYQALSQVWPLCNALCIPRHFFISWYPYIPGANYAAFYTNQRALGRTLEFYSCFLGSQTTDPYNYYRLQAWDCWGMQAGAEHFWSFADDGGYHNPWNEYGQPDNTSTMTPLYLTPTTVTNTKLLEGIRLGVQDYEYFVKLRDRITAVESANPNCSSLPAARNLRDNGAAQVLDAVNADSMDWRDSKDRTTADTVRIEIGDVMHQLTLVPIVVSITSPTDGSYVTNDSATITASASEQGGTINMVIFYANWNIVGIDYDGSDGWSCNWTGITPGSYGLAIHAFDTEGHWQEVGGVTVTKYPPVASITSPTNGASFIVGNSVAITVSASEIGGTVNHVNFYQGGTLLYEDTNPADGWSCSWTPTAAGTYGLWAHAYDTTGNHVESAWTSITVWNTADINASGGSASCTSGVFTVAGKGAGITGTADGFRFVYREISGDCTITAQIIGVTGTKYTNGRSGVMIRQDTASGAREASSLYKPASTIGVWFHRRTSTGGSTSSTASNGSTYKWVRVVRTGNTLKTYKSTNGTSWNQVGSSTTVTMTNPVQVGLAVTSGNTSNANTVTIDNVTLTQP